jgi:hypothetical protein
MKERIVRTRRYFCWSLCLPTGLALAGLAIPSIREAAGLTMIASPVYIPLAIWACSRIKRATQLGDIVLITTVLPLLFFLILLVVFGTFGAFTILSPMLGVIAAVLGVMFGYGFVALAWVLYFLLQKMNFVTAEFTGTRASY